jgi:branched-chain amino acid transport system ATP-binding protein
MTEMLNGTVPAPSTSTVLALEGITVRFGGIVALNDLSLTVGEGEICGLIGPNGAGKTTLFDVISGIRRPERGRVLLEGSDISRLGSARRCQLGLRRTFQRVQTFGWLTVEDNVLAATEWRGGGGGLLADLVGLPTRTRRERQRRASVDATLVRCGLEAVRSEYAGALPIGIARMVEFARATVDRPCLLLLDEPASGLDEQEVARLAQQIVAIRDEAGCAVLVVEHDADFIMRLCDRVIVLDLGTVLAQGTPDEIRSSPLVQAAYLGAGVGPEGSAP